MVKNVIYKIVKLHFVLRRRKNGGDVDDYRVPGELVVVPVLLDPQVRRHDLVPQVLQYR